MNWLANQSADVQQAQALLAWVRVHAPVAVDLALDSRKIKVGDVFLAYPGDFVDGRNFIAAAITAGAVAVLWDAQDFVWDATWTVPNLNVENLKAQVGGLAARFYGDPSTKLHSIGITGTNGKTSISQWLGQALTQAKRPCAVVGTLGIGMSGKLTETGFTTPDAVTLQRELAQLQTHGAQVCAMEVSSIGIQEGRVNGMHFDTAVFTNFTQDHLDYHSSMAQYAEVKRALFAWPGLRAAVLNLDDPLSHQILQSEVSMLDTVVGYSKEPNNNALENDGFTYYSPGVRGRVKLFAERIRHSMDGLSFTVKAHDEAGNLLSHEVETKLVGDFNVSNTLAVIGSLLCAGFNLTDAIRMVGKLTPVAGRMEQLSEPNRPLVVIDYAHTPDALEKVLNSLRPMVTVRQGKLWCLFGCGGDRDAGKRPLMGAIAARLADQIVVTSDNPRSEVPQAIMQAIVDGIPAERHGVLVTQEDRAAAILYAINHAGSNDVVLLAGKGHENYQEVMGKKRIFSDHDHALLALRSRGGSASGVASYGNVKTGRAA